MDDRGRRLGLVRADADDRKNDPRTSSGVVASGTESPSAAELSIAPGVILEGKYLVGQQIGSGAVGIVFEAKNVELDERVAIKCLRPEMLVEDVTVSRFAREAKAAAAIKSEYVASVYDVGTTPQGMPYMVMEYLDGKDLGTIVQESGPLGPRTVVEYALQVCEALAVAHSKGIVHRDIKPENLMLTERAGGLKIVKVLDFGISKAALTGSIFKSAVPLVKTVNLMGTPLYMSPEQVRVTDSVDVRSDIWSLGMVIYEMLTGQTAFDGQSITEICASILETTPRPIEMFRNDLPSGLVEVITKCLQKDASKRFQNIAELALALMPFGPKRTRLNVERAVAALQGSGQLPPHVQVNSTIPPSSSELGLLSIPRAPGIPSDASSSLLPDSGQSTPASAVSTNAQVGPVTTSFTPPTEKRRSVVLMGIAAVVLVLIGAIAATAMKGASSQAAAPPPAVTTIPTPEAKASPPATVTAPATAAVTQTATPPSVADSAPEPLHATAPTAAPSTTQRLSGRVPAAAHSAAPRPKPTGAKSAENPSGEPDLGY